MFCPQLQSDRIKSLKIWLQVSRGRMRTMPSLQPWSRLTTRPIRQSVLMPFSLPEAITDTGWMLSAAETRLNRALISSSHCRPEKICRLCLRLSLRALLSTSSISMPTKADSSQYSLSASTADSEQSWADQIQTVIWQASWTVFCSV